MDEAQEAHWKAFGKYLEVLINQSGLSFTEFGQRAEMTLTQVSRIVNGQSGTRRATMPRFIAALGMIKSEEIREFYQKAGFTPPPMPAFEIHTEQGTFTQHKDDSEQATNEKVLEEIQDLKEIVGKLYELLNAKG